MAYNKSLIHARKPRSEQEPRQTNWPFEVSWKLCLLSFGINRYSIKGCRSCTNLLVCTPKRQYTYRLWPDVGRILLLSRARSQVTHRPPGPRPHPLRAIHLPPPAAEVRHLLVTPHAPSPPLQAWRAPAFLRWIAISCTQRHFNSDAAFTPFFDLNFLTTISIALVAAGWGHPSANQIIGWRMTPTRRS